MPPINTLLPHGPGVQLLDSVIEVSGDRISCGATVGPVAEALAPDLSSTLGIEYMAQTCAVSAGLAPRDPGALPKQGFLVVAKQVQSSIEHFSTGQQLLIQASSELLSENSSSFNCALSDANTGQVLMSGTFTFYLAQ